MPARLPATYSSICLGLFYRESITTGNILFPTAESSGVSAQIGSGVVRGGPEVRFHEGSTRVLPGFHEVLRGLRDGEH